MSDPRIDQRLAVPFHFPVIFTDHVFAVENRTLPDLLLGENATHPPRVLLYLDAGAASTHLSTAAAAAFAAWQIPLVAPPKILPGGELSKNDWPATQSLIGEMLDLHLDRHAFVIIAGGGALLDAIGFAASLIHRGLRVIRIPTTALAQCDGAVGVKTAVNFAGGKNAIGTFAPPFAVINDFQFLFTLPPREWRAGIAEAFKVAIIRDADFFDYLCANTTAFARRDQAPMRHLVHRCAELHLDHIRTGGDPFEMGRARPLDFGHWSAHKLELLSSFQITHGDAVAAGIALDSAYAAHQGWLSDSDFRRIHSALKECGFPLWHPEMDSPQLLQGLQDFQEHLGGDLCITFPDGLGRRREQSQVSAEIIKSALTQLKALASKG